LNEWCACGDKRWASALRGESVQGVYAGALMRQRTSAGAFAEARVLTLSLGPCVRELHFGELEGLSYQEITSRVAEQAWR